MTYTAGKDESTMQFIEFPPMHIKTEGMDLIHLPRMMKIRQIYNSSRIEDIPRHIETQMEQNLSDKQQYRGKRLAISVGSRGIPDLDLIVKTIIDRLKSWGAQPFIFPAMGSHGGATAEGQAEVLASYNITEKSMGVPILSSMDVVQIGSLPDGTPVYCDKYAYESDGIVVLNKVKPHTDFRGRHESGLAKMMAIGIAKHKGASLFHMKSFDTFPLRIEQVCGVFLKNAPIAFGVGIVQNAYDRISRIEVMEKEDILEKDAALLEVAKRSLPTFKFRDIDVLIIDEVGKNISGGGFDPNIVGRGSSKGFENILNLKKLFVRSLTEETHHNAGGGLGGADITTRRCLQSVDFEATWINCVTSTMLQSARIPLYVETDREALLMAIRTCTNIDFNDVKLVRIKNTLRMEQIEVSENYYDLLKDNPEVEILSDPYEIPFDDEGFML